MKTLLVLLTLFVSFSSFSFEKHVCQEYNLKTKKMLNRTLILEKIGAESDQLDENGNYEATKIPYKISFFEGIEAFSEDEHSGIVLTEDVRFEFTSNDKKIKFLLYLDEWEKAYLTIKGQKTSYFVCR